MHRVQSISFHNAAVSQDNEQAHFSDYYHDRQHGDKHQENGTQSNHCHLDHHRHHEYEQDETAHTTETLDRLQHMLGLA